MPVPNRDRLTMVCGRIALEPDRFNQKRYFYTNVTRTASQMNINTGCDTTGCFAGHAVFMYGDPRIIFATNDDSVIYVPAMVGNYTLDPYDGTLVKYNSWCHLGLSRYLQVPVRVEATKLLGLSDSQASWLFASERTREQIYAGVAYILKNPNASGTAIDYHVINKGLRNANADG